jgi:RNA polymerase sigma-70 factor (ECF subfamily)
LRRCDLEDIVVAGSSYSLATPNDPLRGASCPESEARLVFQAKRGHQGAFGELCERYSQKILRTALRITRNREDAEDALQDSFLSAFVHIRKFDGRSSFYTWLTRIAINSALMKLRKNRACREISMDEPLDGGEERAHYEPADASPDPEARCAQRERATMVSGAVRRLRPAIREAVEMRHLQEFSIKETAQALGISVEATKGRLFHARAALRKASRQSAIGQLRLHRQQEFFWARNDGQRQASCGGTA